MFISESPVDHYHFPVGLLLHIINTTWSLPLTEQERVGIMTSWLLVSKDWKRLTAQVVLKHVHVPNEAYYHWHRKFIQEGSPIFDEEMRHHARTNCYSITFAYEYRVRLPSHRYPRYDAVPYLREGHLHIFTGLRDVGVKYINTHFCDLNRDWWVYFVPDQVHTLRLFYVTEETRITAYNYIKRCREETSWPCYHYTRELTGVRTLHLFGMGDGACFEVAAVFPNLTTVWLDGERVQTLRSEPVDPDAFWKFRTLPESGPERTVEKIDAFALNLLRILFVPEPEQPWEDRYQQTLKVLVMEAAEEFAKETGHTLYKLKE